MIDRGQASETLRRDVVAITRNSPLVEVRDLFERFIPEDERIKRLGDVVDRAAILALSGDRERGRLIFTANAAAQCKSCHKAGDVGENVGPDLTKIGTKYNKLALLDQILEPSKTIEPQYTTYLLETKDGRVLSGLAVERTKDRGGAQGRSGQDDRGLERGDRPACSAAAFADAGAVASRPDGAAGGRLAGVSGVVAVKCFAVNKILARKVRGLGCAVDIVMVRESDLEQNGDNPYLVLHTALSEGQEIYRAAS